MNARMRLLLAVCALAPTMGEAATVTITDCAGPPLDTHNRKTVIDLPAHDVVLRCPLMALPGTERVEITAGTITVDGANGGSISVAGKGLSINLKAVGAAPSSNRSILIDAADLIAPNNNGKIHLLAVGDIEVTGSKLQTGGDVYLTCIGPGCTIDVAASTSQSHNVRVLGKGTITVVTSTLATRCPRDLISIISDTGDVVLSATAIGSSEECWEDIASVCPGPSCPLPVMVDTVPKAKALCRDCVRDPNRMTTCVEGDLIVEAPLGRIDVSGSTLHAGEGIRFVALTDVNMSEATIDNCGPKPGVFTVAAATCTVPGATLLDDEPDTAPTLACVHDPAAAAQIGTCTARR